MSSEQSDELNALQNTAPSKYTHDAAQADAAQLGEFVVSIAVVSHPQRVVLAIGSCIYVAEVCAQFPVHPSVHSFVPATLGTLLNQWETPLFGTHVRCCCKPQHSCKYLCQTKDDSQLCALHFHAVCASPFRHCNSSQ
jgi:hypothetical protein